MGTGVHQARLPGFLIPLFLKHQLLRRRNHVFDPDGADAHFVELFASDSPAPGAWHLVVKDAMAMAARKPYSRFAAATEYGDAVYSHRSGQVHRPTIVPDIEPGHFQQGRAFPGSHAATQVDDGPTPALCDAGALLNLIGSADERQSQIGVAS
ncbi:hypothetical protein D3C72_1246620 [compost metagenome]